MTTTTIPAHSVHERDGHWSVFFRIDGARYKRRLGPSRGPGALSARAARRRAGEVVLEHAAMPKAPRRTGDTFADAAREYLEHAERVKGAKPSTLKDYRSMLAEAGAIMGAIGAKKLGSITAADVEGLLEAVQSGGASARTVNKVRGMVGAVFNLAVRKAKCATNPARATDRRREGGRPAIDTYCGAEVEVLAAAAADEQDAAMFRTAAYTGMRLGELLALRWGDVGDGMIVVQRAVSAGVVTDTKSHRIRHVPLPPRLEEQLRRLRGRPDFVGDAELVFPDWCGRPLTRFGVADRFKRARDAADLRPLTFHGLRHSYCSMLAAAGVPLHEIQAAAGHSTPTVTAIYLHARSAASQAERFGAALGG
jgi:integrase